jgi:hypothetical protein
LHRVNEPSNLGLPEENTVLDEIKSITNIQEKMIDAKATKPVFKDTNIPDSLVKAPISSSLLTAKIQPYRKPCCKNLLSKE